MQVGKFLENIKRAGRNRRAGGKLIDFPENFPPARLFGPAPLMFSKNFPTCTFISPYTSIQHTRVVHSFAIKLLKIMKMMLVKITYYLMHHGKLWGYYLRKNSPNLRVKIWSPEHLQKNIIEKKDKLSLSFWISC